MDNKKILAVMVLGSIVSLSFAVIGRIAEKTVKPVATTAGEVAKTVAKPIVGVVEMERIEVVTPKVTPKKAVVHKKVVTPRGAAAHRKVITPKGTVAHKRAWRWYNPWTW